MNATLLKTLCLEYEHAAKTLVEQKIYSSAYHQIGISLELGIKAYICRMFNAREIPEKKFVNDIYEHDPSKLLAVARLTTDRDNKINTSPVFRRNWGIVKNWNVSSRYNIHSEDEAINMINAMTENEHGVITWIKSLW